MDQKIKWNMLKADSKEWTGWICEFGLEKTEWCMSMKMHWPGKCFDKSLWKDKKFPSSKIGHSKVGEISFQDRKKFLTCRLRLWNNENIKMKKKIIKWRQSINLYLTSLKNWNWYLELRIFENKWVTSD